MTSSLQRPGPPAEHIYIFWAPRTWGADWWESVSFDEITISHFFITGIEWSIFKTLFYLSIWVNPNNSFSLSQWIKIFVSQAAPILLLHKDVQCNSCRCVLKSTAHQNTTAMPSLTVSITILYCFPSHLHNHHNRHHITKSQSSQSSQRHQHRWRSVEPPHQVAPQASTPCYFIRLTIYARWHLQQVPTQGGLSPRQQVRAQEILLFRIFGELDKSEATPLTAWLLCFHECHPL